MSVDQTCFRAALTDPAQPAPAGLTDPHGAPAGKRFDVYRNNVALSLIEALSSSFPVIAKLLGPERMDLLARVFTRQHPPTNPILPQYGAALPRFLETFEPLQNLGYLPDIARLELALRQSYHAADSTPIAPDALTALPPDALTETCLHIAPSVHLVRSDWPIFDIWRFNMENGPKPQPGPQSVLITRAEFDPVPHLLTDPQASFLTALIAGHPLGKAMDLSEEFDLIPLLQLLLAQNALTGLTTKG